MTLNSEQIKEILPHRYPFLLVDRITDMEPGKFAKGIKCVSQNEMHFEALAQTGACALLCAEENKGKLAFFGGVKNCRFKRQVVPGDVLTLECEIIKSRGNVGFGNVVATVDGEVACSGEISFAIG